MPHNPKQKTLLEFHRNILLIALWSRASIIKFLALCIHLYLVILRRCKKKLRYNHDIGFLSFHFDRFNAHYRWYLVSLVTTTFQNKASKVDRGTEIMPWKWNQNWRLKGIIPERQIGELRSIRFSVILWQDKTDQCEENNVLLSAVPGLEQWMDQGSLKVTETIQNQTPRTEKHR